MTPEREAERTGQCESHKRRELEDVHYAEGVDSYGPFEQHLDPPAKLLEVLPGDPDPEWVDRLIKICEKSGRYAPDRIVHQIKKHLAKRGEK